jgi:hypothetical protein
MASVGFFLLMVVIAVILLIIASILSTKAAIDIFSFSGYPTDSFLKSAHQTLIISSVIGWISIVILTILLIVSYTLGAFTLVEVVSLLNKKGSLTTDDLLKVHQGEKKLSSALTAGTILLVVMSLISVVVLFVCILCAIAATSINRSPNISQPVVKNAYTAAVIAAVLGMGVIFSIVIALVIYFSLRKDNEKEEKSLETLTEPEKKLN